MLLNLGSSKKEIVKSWKIREIIKTTEYINIMALTLYSIQSLLTRRAGKLNLIIENGNVKKKYINRPTINYFERFSEFWSVSRLLSPTRLIGLFGFATKVRLTTDKYWETEICLTLKMLKLNKKLCYCDFWG